MEVLFIVAVIGFVGYRFLTHSAKIDAMKNEEGKMIDRPKQFMHQKHVFTTKVSSLNDIWNLLDIEALKAIKIKGGTTPDEKGLEFNYSYNHRAGFTAFLIHESSQTDLQNFVFYFSEIEGNIGNSEANILLTDIEKAFLELDNDTTVDRELVEFKSKTRFY